MITTSTKVPVSDLQLGMYVSELDRPWLETPFLVQGFLIRDPAELQVLAEVCEYVVIDERKSPAVIKQTAKRRPIGKSIKQSFPTRKLKPYAETTSFEDEMLSARKIFEDYERATVKIFDNARSGMPVDIKTADEAVNNIVNSLVRNPSACTLLQKIKKKGDTLYNHAIGTSIWSAAIGRQIGLPPIDLKRLAISGLLCDIGKVNISTRILDKPSELSESELEIVRSHVIVDDSFNEKFPGLADSVVTIIEAHHERHDGSGYPAGLKGDDIPVFSRIVGLADSYDAMTSDKPYAKAMSSYDAAKELYDLRDIHYQAEIVEEFIQAVGLYPVGSLVELNNGEVGVVVDVYEKRRLRPNILMLLDADKNALGDVIYRDLLTDDFDEQGIKLEIKNCLQPGAYGLDADAFFP